MQGITVWFFYLAPVVAVLASLTAAGLSYALGDLEDRCRRRRQALTDGALVFVVLIVGFTGAWMLGGGLADVQ